MKKKLFYTLLLSITMLLIINPQKSVICAKNALNLCGDIIIPSLFPFFVCSGLLITSGFADIMARGMRKIMKPLFNVNGAGSVPFILGIISGYPLGALAVCRLYQNCSLSKHEAERLLSFCNNSGPLFILGAVGISLYHSPKVGVILYTSHILSAVITGIVFRFYQKNKFIAPYFEEERQEKSIAEIFSAVLSDSINSILTVCGAVIFFGVISGILTDLLPLSEKLRIIFSGIMEFTSGINALSQSSFLLFEKLVISAGIIGFAGISVHIQVMGIIAGCNLSILPYIIGKILQSIISMALTAIILKFIPLNISVIAPAGYQLSGSFAMNSLFIVITVLSVFFIMLSFGIYFIAKRKYQPSR